MKTILFISSLFITAILFSQEKRIISFDLTNGNIDTLDLVEFDTLITKDQTDFFIGNFDNNISILETVPPENNVFPDSEFSLREKADLDYDINSFPIRTSVKLFKLENDSIMQKCSGSLISKKQ